MTAGYVVKVFVQDVNAKIAGGAKFRVAALASSGWYSTSILAAWSGSTAEYDLTIPLNRTARLVLDTNLSVSDANGAAVPSGQPSATLTGPANITLTAR